MARPPRLHVPGDCYPVILRGNHREALFGHAADRDVLDEIVADVIERFGARIHAFCNPVKAQIVSNPSDYPWSSHRRSFPG